MADGYEDPWVPPDSPSYPDGVYEQACDVQSRNASDNTSGTADTDDTTYSAGGRPSAKPRRRGSVLAVLGLCALVSLAVIVLAQLHQAAGNTDQMLVSMNNKAEADGKVLQDFLLTLMTHKQWGRRMPGQDTIDTTVSATNGIGVPSTDVTGMRSSTAADDTITTRAGSTNQLPLFSNEEIRACEDETLTITCGSGKRIHILTAMYGRMTPLMCYRGFHHAETCRSSKNLPVLMSICQGKPTCSVEASNEVFGDPCYGVYKYLKVTYICTGTHFI
ncbi:EVA1C [Branchiostoma lanceolatum]|uniref:EVA1C protein n=1 Tax=Branchiostoma lanceolatum TaxID=7740 RepID=A0A8K0EEW0_BRALA|nr:EVA1C [Branchiostoma lanceolatum]